MLTGAEIRRKYLLHTSLHKFTENLFFAFGALLIFAKTQSLAGTLAVGVAGDIAALLMKSAGFGLSIRLFRKWGVMGTMSLGLILKAASLCGIFYLLPGSAHFYPVLFALTVLGSIGNSPYVFGASALMFGVIGTSRKPGHSSAFIETLQTLSGLIATLAGAVLGFHGSFTYAFLLGGVILLGSTLPLRGIPTPALPPISFWSNLKKVPKSMLAANVNPDHQLMVIAVPLIALGLSSSLKTSIWINALIAGATIALSYAAGWVKDHHGSWLTWLAFACGACAWASFGFIGTPIGLLLPSIVANFTSKIITIGRESRMSRELYWSENVFEGTMAIEFARSVGILIGSAGILVVYLVFHNLPVAMLICGAFFVIPKAMYAAGAPRREGPAPIVVATHPHTQP